jgi:hypothetical protein
MQHTVFNNTATNLSGFAGAAPFKLKSMTNYLCLKQDKHRHSQAKVAVRHVPKTKGTSLTTPLPPFPCSGQIYLP